MMTRSFNKRHKHHAKRNCGICNDNARVKNEEIEKKRIIENNLEKGMFGKMINNFKNQDLFISLFR